MFKNNILTHFIEIVAIFISAILVEFLGLIRSFRYAHYTAFIAMTLLLLCNFQTFSNKYLSICLLSKLGLTQISNLYLYSTASLFPAHLSATAISICNICGIVGPYLINKAICFQPIWVHRFIFLTMVMISLQTLDQINEQEIYIMDEDDDSDDQ